MSEETHIERNFRYLQLAEERITRARQFLRLHEPMISDLSLLAIPATNELLLRPRLSTGKPPASSIAKRFPGAEWKRGGGGRKNSDWSATIAGVTVVIVDADAPGELPEKVDLGKGGEA